MSAKHIRINQEVTHLGKTSKSVTPGFSEKDHLVFIYYPVVPFRSLSEILRKYPHFLRRFHIGIFTKPDASSDTADQ
jgi:hypothetical protein